MQRPDLRARGERLVGGDGSCARTVLIQGDDGVERIVARCDTRELRVEGFDGADTAPADCDGQRGRRAEGIHRATVTHNLGRMTGSAAAIEVHGLRVRRGGRDVLPGIDVDVPAGRITGLVGPSGGGKSTLIRAIVGVQVVAGGTVTVLGEPAGAPSLRSRVAYVTQSGSVYQDLTVRQNVDYTARILGARRRPGGRGDRDRRPHVGHRGLGNLSGGQQHRVSLACALLGAPELLVLDEPTVGLDPLLRRDLWELFSRLRDEGRTLLISTHVLDEAANCDKVLLLRDGRLLAAESPAALRREAGTDDLDEAFLRLIERRGGGAS